MFFSGLYIHVMQQAQAPATTGSSRIEKLNVAAALHQFDKSLNRSAWESLGWGAFSALIGWVQLARNARFGWVNLIFGVLLMVVGLYEKRVREARVIKVSAATLAFLGLWNLAGFVMAIMALGRVVGHPWVAALQLLGAWTTYKSYATYAGLLAASDPATNQEFELMLQQLNAADPATAPDVVEFTAKKFGKNDMLWRTRRMDDFMLFVGNERVLGRKKSLSQCFFVARQQVRVEILGEKMFGRNQKARITAGDQQWNVTIAPEMAQKLTMLAG